MKDLKHTFKPVPHSAHSEKLSSQVKQVHGGNSVRGTLVGGILDVAPPPVLARDIAWG